ALRHTRSFPTRRSSDLPGERDKLDDEPVDAQALRQKYLDVLNTQQRVNPAARVIARYLLLNHSIEPLIATLARGVLREDADFHRSEEHTSELQSRGHLV